MAQKKKPLVSIFCGSEELINSCSLRTYSRGRADRRRKDDSLQSAEAVYDRSYRRRLSTYGELWEEHSPESHSYDVKLLWWSGHEVPICRARMIM